MACDCGYKSDQELLCEIFDQLVILNGGAGSGLDFELRTVKDANGDLFQLRMKLDEGADTYSIDFIDANGSVATPVAPVEYLDPTTASVTLGQQASSNSAPVVLSVEQEALLDDMITELIGIGGDTQNIDANLTTLLGLFTGTTVPKSDDISNNASFVIPANSKNSVTLVVEEGSVDFDGTTHEVGSYTWTAPLLKKLDAMTFDATNSPNAKILSTQSI